MRARNDLTETIIAVAGSPSKKIGMSRGSQDDGTKSKQVHDAVGVNEVSSLSMGEEVSPCRSPLIGIENQDI